MVLQGRVVDSREGPVQLQHRTHIQVGHMIHEDDVAEGPLLHLAAAAFSLLLFGILALCTCRNEQLGSATLYVVVYNIDAACNVVVVAVVCRCNVVCSIVVVCCL